MMKQMWLLGEPPSIYGDTGGKDPGLIATVAFLPAFDLIFHAPELLQACKEAATLLEEMGHGDLVTAIDLRAVIARAEGR